MFMKQLITQNMQAPPNIHAVGEINISNSNMSKKWVRILMLVEINPPNAPESRLVRIRKAIM